MKNLPAVMLTDSSATERSDSILSTTIVHISIMLRYSHSWMRKNSTSGFLKNCFIQISILLFG